MSLFADSEPLVIRAVRTRQADDIDVYAFFVRGTDVLRIADISRIQRDEQDELRGFQRTEIKNHVNSIVEFLDKGTVLFPNAIILALSPEVRFSPSRGSEPKGLVDVAQSGTLTIPVRDEGHRVAWIVDGQQRSLALARTRNRNVVVPVIGFVSADTEVHREQFILVNKARPLPSRLINELLPETADIFPRELSVRKLPSELCNLLNRRSNSPFHDLIRRPSDRDGGRRVVTDTAVVNMIKTSIGSPSGALMPFKGTGTQSPNAEAMYQTLCLFWGVVRDTFPEAWGRPPTESRLMHGAGIQAMGHLMDRVMARAAAAANPEATVREALARLAPHCRWTEGQWEGIGLTWNEVQNVPKHIRALADLLARLDYEGARRAP